ncbi:MAG: c-type cytochrome domain-containing protein, partial [Verrucomicrobiota bacterium]
ILAGLIASPPSANAVPVSFRKEIAPLLQRRCVGCHGEESAKGGYRLDTFEKIGKPGESELIPLTAGNPDGSELHALLLEKSPEDRMPQKADPLPAQEIALIERWIREGAINDGGAPNRPLTELVRDSLLLPAPEKYPRPAPVTALAFSPDGTQLAVSGYYEITLWEVETGVLMRRIGGLPERIHSIAWNSQVNLIAVGGGSPSQWGGVFLIDPAAGYQVRLLADLPDTALDVAFSPDGKRVAACGGDRSIRLFETATAKPVRLLKQHADLVQTVSFSDDGSRLVSASRDRTARVFSVEEGEVVAAYDEHEAPVLAADFSPDGHTIFSITRSRPIHSWHAASGQRKGQFIEAGRDTQRLAATRLGLLSGSTDGLVRLSDPDDRRTVRTFFGHHDCVESIAVAPDGRRFATGAHDGEVCIWTSGCETWVRHFIATP